MKLSKKQLEKKESLALELEDAARALQTGIADAREGLNDFVNEYNSVVGKINDLKSEIIGDLTRYMDNKTEQWHESEKGQAHEEFKNEFEYFDLDAYTLPDFDEPDPDNISSELQGLPEEPEV